MEMCYPIIDDYRSQSLSYIKMAIREIKKHKSGSQIFYNKKQGIIGFITDKGEKYNLSGLIKSTSTINQKQQ